MSWEVDRYGAWPDGPAYAGRRLFYSDHPWLSIRMVNRGRVEFHVQDPSLTIPSLPDDGWENYLRKEVRIEMAAYGNRPTRLGRIEVVMKSVELADLVRAVILDRNLPAEPLLDWVLENTEPWVVSLLELVIKEPARADKETPD